MKIFNNYNISKVYKRASLAIGNFDGCHQGHQKVFKYAKKFGIPVKATKESPWSSDENLMHISFESGMLEDPWQAPLQEMFELSNSPQQAPSNPQEILIEFK